MADAGADESVTAWPCEAIPPDHHLFMRIHESFVRNGDVGPGVFSDQDGSMSTDWCRYSTPEQARCRARNPARNGVIQLRVGGVAAVEGVTVKHRPDAERRNHAHTDVRGEKTAEVRLKFYKLRTWVIGVKDAVPAARETHCAHVQAG